MDRIISARFIAKTQSTVTVAFEMSKPIADSADVKLYIGDKCACSKAAAEKSGAYIAQFAAELDFSANCMLEVEGHAQRVAVSKVFLLDDESFIKTYECADTQKQALGAIYTAQSTVLRIWAPLASAVTVRLYADGAVFEPESEHKMTKHMPPHGGKWGGVWECTLQGDQNGKYYTYVVVNNGIAVETIDPYARACGANGMRGMILDLADTDPDGWAADKVWYKKHQSALDTPIIWEVSVNDFSSSSDSGMKYKGKYLAFTEKNTSVPGLPELKTGIDYLKDLGVTYVQLNPVYDFATVDESDMTVADGGSFNWGYDPQNYNIPEGSYSTDPANGEIRINEFKRMVKALHDAGIGVVMDVVYNHTYATSGQALHDIVPYYYHRTEKDGSFSNDSGCGNGTASERAMVRKYIIESVRYWAEEYHIDGFRFDLMGIHDTVTLNLIRAELDSIDGGRRILMYGEPWSADGGHESQSYINRIAATRELKIGKYVNNAGTRLMKCVFGDSFGRDNALDILDERIAIFNGSGRDGLRGACHDRAPQQGWANGTPGDLARVRRMLEGGIGGYGEGLMVGAGSRNIAYSAAHDNYTLWDQIRAVRHGNESALYYDDPEPNDIKKCMLVAAAYMMSGGIAFMLAGEEMGRTKYGNENSYDSPAKLNRINWARQKTFGELYAFYKSLIALRRTFSEKLFSYEKSTVKDFCYGNFVKLNYGTGAFAFEREQGGTKLRLELDPSSLKGCIAIGNKKLTIG